LPLLFTAFVPKALKRPSFEGRSTETPPKLFCHLIKIKGQLLSEAVLLFEEKHMRSKASQSFNASD
jgi:hypothetical protein